MRTPQPTLDIWGLNNRAPDDPLNPEAAAPTAATPRPRDWSGSSQSVFKTLGASNHCEDERQIEDYYATDPEAVEMLLDREEFDHTIWEPACGGGHISRVLESHGYDVVSTDLIDRGYGKGGIDFLKCDDSVEPQIPFSIVTNPPYRYAQEFVERALSLVRPGGKVAMFLKLTFLEGQSRWRLFRDNPPIRVWVSCRRLVCAKNGDFDATEGSAVAYAWFIFEKGYKGDPAIKWFNTPEAPPPKPVLQSPPLF